MRTPLASLLALSLFLAAPRAPAQAPDPAELLKTRLVEADAALRKEVADLVEFAVKQGLYAEARLELAWARERIADAEALAAVAEKIPDSPAYTEIAVWHAKGKAWLDRRAKAHEKAAGKLHDAANWAKGALPAELDGLIDRGLAVDPDHKALRKLRGQTLVAPVGWVDEKDAPNLRKGMVKDGGVWIPRAEAAKRHTRWDDPWVIETEHFEVHCNVSLDDAYRVGRLAELTYDMFWRVFSGSPDLRKPEKKLRVYYFASIADAREERKKVHTQQPDMPPAAYGYYAYEDLAAHFWVTSESAKEFERTTRPTMHHEIGHQLAHNLLHGPLKADPQKKPEFWLVEGLGVYFDDLREDKSGLPSLWNWESDAFRGILSRGVERAHMPFDKYLAMTGAEFYKGSEDDIKNHYGQAGLMAHFFLYGEKGKYRGKFMEYARIVNEGGGEEGLLTRTLGAPLTQLEQEWLAFVKKMGKGGK